MEKSKISTIIIDDNKDFCNILNEYFYNHRQVIISGIANDGREALDIIKEKKPDLLILDMIMPYLDGFGVLEALNTMKICPKPKTIVLSAVGRDKLIQRAFSLGADYYFAKPINMDLLGDRINELFSINAYDNNFNRPVAKIDTSETSTNKNRSFDLEIQITNIMHEIGFPAHIKGYIYLREAIVTCINDTNFLSLITSSLYPLVADKHNTTASRVERSMRHAIEVAWSRAQVDTINRLFGNTINKDNGKPTNSEFIAMIVDIIRIKNKVS
jgi:two-component system, response regulator, stage 0 sporulation protein A